MQRWASRIIPSRHRAEALLPAPSLAWLRWGIGLVAGGVIGGAGLPVQAATPTANYIIEQNALPLGWTAKRLSPVRPAAPRSAPITAQTLPPASPAPTKPAAAPVVALTTPLGREVAPLPQAAPPAPTPAATPIAAPTPQPSPPAAPLAIPVAVPPTAKPLVRIAVLLPLQSPSLGEAAKVVKQGIEAASRLEGGATLTVYDVEDSTVRQRYGEALAAGAQSVIGPLTRPHIAAITPVVKVPTLVLNTLDTQQTTPAQLYSLSAAVEGDAVQLARRMRESGRRTPLVVVGKGGLDTRIASAFGSEWRSLTGRPPREWTLGSPASLSKEAEQADAVVLAVEASGLAGLAASLVNKPIYATSQLNDRSLPLKGLGDTRVVDMPWLVAPERAVVQRYPRLNPPLPYSSERLYALGIDAFRQALLLATTPPSGKMEGVSGTLTLGRDRQFVRELPLVPVSPL